MYTNTGNRRLIDYYFVVSCSDNGKQQVKRKLAHKSLASRDDRVARHALFALKPKIIVHYPDSQHADTPLLPWVARAAMPRGVRARTKPPSPRFFTFTGWNPDGSKLYGCCLEVFEKIDVKNQEQILFIPKTLGFISHYPYYYGFTIFLSCLWHAIPRSLISLEELLMHYFYDIPAPSPKKKIAYDLGQMKILFACRNEFDIPIMELSNDLFFTQFSKDRIVQVLKLLLLEKRVMLVCSDVAELTPMCESIKCLLFPFRWNHLYISQLSLLAARDLREKFGDPHRPMDPEELEAARKQEEMEDKLEEIRWTRIREKERRRKEERKRRRAAGEEVSDDETDVINEMRAEAMRGGSRKGSASSTGRPSSRKVSDIQMDTDEELDDLKTDDEEDYTAGAVDATSMDMGGSDGSSSAAPAESSAAAASAGSDDRPASVRPTLTPAGSRKSKRSRDPFFVGIPRFIYIRPEIKDSLPKETILVLSDRNQITDVNRNQIDPSFLPSLPDEMENELKDCIHLLSVVICQPEKHLSRENVLKAYRTLISLMRKLIFHCANFKISPHRTNRFIMSFRQTQLCKNFLKYYRRINPADDYQAQVYEFYKRNEGLGKNFARKPPRSAWGDALPSHYKEDAFVIDPAAIKKKELEKATVKKKGEAQILWSTSTVNLPAEFEWSDTAKQFYAEHYFTAKMDAAKRKRGHRKHMIRQFLRNLRAKIGPEKRIHACIEFDKSLRDSSVSEELFIEMLKKDTDSRLRLLKIKASMTDSLQIDRTKRLFKAVNIVVEMLASKSPTAKFAHGDGRSRFNHRVTGSVESTQSGPGSSISASPAVVSAFADTYERSPYHTRDTSSQTSLDSSEIMAGSATSSVLRKPSDSTAISKIRKMSMPKDTMAEKIAQSKASPTGVESIPESGPSGGDAASSSTVDPVQSAIEAARLKAMEQSARIQAGMGKGPSAASSAASGKGGAGAAEGSDDEWESGSTDDEDEETDDSGSDWDTDSEDEMFLMDADMPDTDEYLSHRRNSSNVRSEQRFRHLNEFELKPEEKKFHTLVQKKLNADIGTGTPLVVDTSEDLFTASVSCSNIGGITHPIQ